MDDNLSVAKGVFVYKNGFKPTKPTTTKKRKRNRRSSKSNESEYLIDNIQDQLWHQSFRKLWDRIEADIQDLLDTNYSRVLTDLREFLAHSDRDMYHDLFPVAVLLNGINQPDHYEQFEILAEKICENPKVQSTILRSRDAHTLKAAIECLVGGFLASADSDDEGTVKKGKLKKGHCIMRALRDWYFEQGDDEERVLTAIIPDFELFNKQVLRDLILIVGSYREQLPLVLIFGVATTVSALENALPLQFTSKAKFHVFKSQSSINNLNAIVENVLLNPRNNFQLSGKSLQLLVEIFLFYDFSITGFVQGFKLCLLEHFSNGNHMSLCEDLAVGADNLDQLEDEELEAIRQLMSMRDYIEHLADPQQIVNLLCVDHLLIEHVREVLLPNVLQFIHTFYLGLHCVYILMHDLPRMPFGKQFREFYCAVNQAPDFCASTDFQETLNMLQFSTKSELVSKIKKIIALFESHINNYANSELEEVLRTIKDFLQTIEAASTEMSVARETVDSSAHLNVVNRHELRERLKEMSLNQQNQRSQFQTVVKEFLEHLRTRFFVKHVVALQKGPPLIELFLFADSQTLRKHIVGAPRAALHQALKSPNHYLLCDCCDEASGDQLRATQPDLSIVYKLHLECGKMINLYDWLQAFKSIVQERDNDEDDNSGNVDPVILARFTRAISELQFLGFIKSSKRKTDHVTRLTW